MVRASQVSATLYAGKVPVFQGVEESIKAGFIPGGSQQNLDYVNPHIVWGSGLTRKQKITLADAQTSGGLLISVPEPEAKSLLSAIRQAGCSDAEIIGELINLSDHSLYIN